MCGACTGPRPTAGQRWGHSLPQTQTGFHYRCFLTYILLLLFTLFIYYFCYLGYLCCLFNIIYIFNNLLEIESLLLKDPAVGTNVGQQDFWPFVLALRWLSPTMAPTIDKLARAGPSAVVCRRWARRHTGGTQPVGATLGARQMPTASPAELLRWVCLLRGYHCLRAFCQGCHGLCFLWGLHRLWVFVEMLPWSAFVVRLPQPVFYCKTIMVCILV